MTTGGTVVVVRLLIVVNNRLYFFKERKESIEWWCPGRSQWEKNNRRDEEGHEVGRSSGFCIHGLSWRIWKPDGCFLVSFTPYVNPQQSLIFGPLLGGVGG